MNSFWESRRQGKLRKHAEKHGQELLGVFAKAKLMGRGSAIREAACGIGFVDVIVTFSSGLLHMVEMKILKGSEIPGPAQLATYMAHKNRREGWLVIFDARKPELKKDVPSTFERSPGIIRTVTVDINPIPPHKAV